VGVAEKRGLGEANYLTHTQPAGESILTQGTRTATCAVSAVKRTNRASTKLWTNLIRPQLSVDKQRSSN